MRTGMAYQKRGRDTFTTDLSSSTCPRMRTDMAYHKRGRDTFTTDFIS